MEWPENFVVLMQDKKNIPLIISNHYMIAYYNMLNAPGFNWEYYNDNFKDVIDMKENIEQTDVINEIRECIKASSSYKKKHILHDSATVFGYDDSKQIFIVGDNS